MSIRLHIVAEGQSEETFVNRVLRPHLAQFEVYADVHRITTKRDKRHGINHRGGLNNYEHVRRDLELWFRQERGRPEVWFTTLLDLYAFPTDERSPYSETISRISDPVLRVEALEAAMQETALISNFIPYVQLHEFEALVLCDAGQLSDIFPDHRTAVDRLCAEIEGIAPEAINDGPETAPSKRIIRYIPEYKLQKPTVGALMVEAIGLSRLRECCPHFNQWVSRLEHLSPQH